MNFNISENPSYNLQEYELIKKDYTESDLTVTEIRPKYKWLILLEMYSNH